MMFRLRILCSTINSYLVVHDSNVGGITLYIKKNNPLDSCLFNAFSNIIRDIDISSCFVEPSVLIEAMPYYSRCNQNRNVSFNIIDNNTTTERLPGIRQSLDPYYDAMNPYNQSQSNQPNPYNQSQSNQPNPYNQSQSNQPNQSNMSNFMEQMLNTVLRSTPENTTPEISSFLIPLPNNINDRINFLLNSYEEHDNESKNQLNVYQPNNSEEKDVYVSSPFTVPQQTDDRKMTEVKEHSVREQVLEQVIASIIRHITVKKMHPPNFTLTTVKNRRKIKNFVYNISGVQLNESEIRQLITHFTNNPVPSA